MKRGMMLTLVVGAIGVFSLACSLNSGDKPPGDSGAGSDACNPIPLVGTFVADRSSVSYYDNESGGASMYCELQDFVSTIQVAGPTVTGDYVATWSATGDELHYAGGMLDDSGAFASRFNSQPYFFAVLEVSSTGNINGTFYDNTPGHGNDLTTFEGSVSDDGKVITVDTWNGDPTWNSGSDPVGCGSFYFGTMVHTWTGAGQSAAAQLDALRVAADDELAVCDPPDPVDTADTGTSAEEVYMARKLPKTLPEGYPPTGQIPPTSITTATTIWHSMDGKTGAAWLADAHNKWEALFQPSVNNGPQPIIGLIGPGIMAMTTPNGQPVVNLPQMRTAGHGVIDKLGLSEHIVERNVIGILLDQQAEQGTAATQGKLEVDLGFLINGLSAPPPGSNPPPPQ